MIPVKWVLGAWIIGGVIAIAKSPVVGILFIALGVAGFIILSLQDKVNRGGK
jgi:hypothetical protein